MEAAPTLNMETRSQEVAALLDEHSYSRRSLTVKEQLQAAQMELDRLLTGEQLFLQRLQHEPEMILFYTGFKDYNTLKAFYLALQPTPKTIGNWSRALKINNSSNSKVDAGFCAQHLCLFDQLFLFLCSVRRGFLPIDMYTQFRVSEDVVQTTWITWCHYLFFMLGPLPIWPSRQAVNELMPPFFRTTFPKTRVVLHMTEIRIQLPACTENSSHHKGSTTLKSLIGIAPSGSVSFVSSLYTAAVSHKDAIRESGVLNLLEPGDQVLTDESLEIKDLLDVSGVNLVSLTLSQPNRQSVQDDLTHTDSGLLKVHMRRAIGRLKECHIFDDVVPSALSGSVDQLWTVCALLTNFQEPLI
ncbi:Fanconi anemia core complex-associated protein 24 isoform X2 [Trachinotus anak]|uniref:Fanconi anemia core complex-associated protein 24 isoform X2 n=1 Tax=Trachinotus anak TaxID=443729 RepID=UPI0039F1E1BA